MNSHLQTRKGEGENRLPKFQEHTPTCAFISSVFTDCGEILLSTFSLKIDEPSLAWLVLVCETQSPMKVAFFQVTSRDPELFGDRYSLLHSPSGKELLADTSQRHHLPKLSPAPTDWEHQGTRDPVLPSPDHAQVLGLPCRGSKPWALGVYTSFPSFPEGYRGLLLPSALGYSQFPLILPRIANSRLQWPNVQGTCRTAAPWPPSWLN